MNEINAPEAVRGICSSLHARGFRSWAVGGAVRDALRRNLGLAEPARTEADWDIATDARPEQVQRVFKRVIPTGIEHGTVTVIIDKVHYEVTTLRADVGYSDGRRPDRVEFVADIHADLARRDFTINAIAYDVLAETLIDPFGGIDDLKARHLKAVGNPLERFAEDGLRVLRAARFLATLELDFDPETERAIRPSLDSFRKVSAERVRDEWLKSLKASRPSIAFEVMRAHGLLEVTCPELARLAATRPDAWQHALRCLDGAPHTPTIQLAVLLHDVAKGQATDGAQPSSFAELSGGIAERILRNLRFSNHDRERIAALIRHHDVGYERSWSDGDLRRWLRRVGPELALDLLLLIGVIASARPMQDAEQLRRVEELDSRARRELRAKPALEVRDLALNGGDLIRDLGLSPGPHMGKLLERLLDEVLEDPSLNQRDTLLARAKSWSHP